MSTQIGSSPEGAVSQATSMNSSGGGGADGESGEQLIDNFVSQSHSESIPTNILLPDTK
jgi:hypothetical protein